MKPCWNSLLSTISLQNISDLNNLPALFITPLEDSALLRLSGEQSHSYLQGQLTCDMEKLGNSNYLNAAHCDAKGKMWAIVKVFAQGEDFFLSGHQHEIAASLTQLNKYGVFAKTTITDVSTQWLTLGLGGCHAAAWLKSQWQIEFAPGQHSADIGSDVARGKVLQLAPERYLLLIASDQVAALLDAYRQHLVHSELWSIQDIQAGLAHLDDGTVTQYVPQMLNLHCLDAISFDKGCYSGQEMIARMKYLGKNKRGAYILRGHAAVRPNPADELQLAIGDNWRRSGSIVNVAGSNDDLHILAVLPNNTEADARLRIKDDEHSALTLSPLPYSLEQL